MAANLSAKPAPKLAVGDKAPNFKLPSDDGGTVSLADFKGGKLVIYFYPRADTPGCTKESIDFSRLKAAFVKKHDLSIPLGSDETTEMLTAYGAWGEKSLYGRKFKGVIRSTVLIDEKGRIAQVWPKVKVPAHAEAVLEAAKAL
jgi:peroxiredoxin Q/BCP